jgi:predicted permease
MMRLAIALLERAFGAERAESILGDLEEDLSLGRCPRWANAVPGMWLLVEAIAHVVMARWAGAAAECPDATRAGRVELTSLWQDVRYAIRSLRSTPTFTLVALVVLALVIGASTAVFSVVDAVVLRGLPYSEPDRLVQLGTVDLRTGAFERLQPPQNFADWQSRQNVFAALAATRRVSGFTVNENGVPQDLLALQVTAGYFEVYRAYPQLGHVFTSERFVEGNDRVALISDDLWRRQFGADPHVIGRTLRSTAALTYGAPLPIQAGTWTIVGVMPRGFQSPADGTSQTDVWVPYVRPENARPRGGSSSASLEVTARLADGVTVEQADVQIRAITASLADASPAPVTHRRGAVRTLQDAIVGNARAWMFLLLGAVGVVLLIGCVNVASLLLARTTARGRDIRIRIALGASRWRIARGLLVESLVLAAAGLLLGLLVAVWGIDVLRSSLPASLPRVSTVALNMRVLGVSAMTTIVTGLLFGLTPAIRSSRSRATMAWHDASRGSTAAGTRLRSTLVVSEIALAVVLTIGIGLFLSSFVRVANVDIGLDPRNVLTMPVWPKLDRSSPGWLEPALTRSAMAIPQIVDRVSAIPGVVSAGFIAGDLPLTGYSARASVSVTGQAQPFDGNDGVEVRYVTPGYAKAVGMPVRRGRYIEADDARGSTPVVVLNEEAVARYLGDRHPLGAVIAIAGYAREATVVGVVGNVRPGGPEGAVPPEAYLPAAQGRFLGGALAVRTTREPLALAAAVRQAVRASFPDISEPEAATMASRLDGLLARRRFTLLVVGLFGVLALAIASAGLYGVMASLVTQRTREIGVRLALGASPARVMMTMIGRGVAHTAAGTTVGLAATWLLAPFVQAFLFDVGPRDAFVYTAATAVLTACGVLAAFVPARRAARVDPAIALRAE